MAQYEYRVTPAPARARKIRGADTVEARYAETLAETLNREGADGWEYLRAETLPVEERSGFRRTRTTFRTVLIFRRPVDVDDSEATRAALRQLENADRPIPEA
ncbi:MAG: DUF4177 domain-containing protein [Rhodobacteraceae bacterium]|nr:DUF4177 domain-containing protein [Paracoccaceae bacterium]